VHARARTRGGFYRYITRRAERLVSAMLCWNSRERGNVRIIEVGFSGTVGTDRMGPVSNAILELANRFAEQGHEVILTDVASTARRKLLDKRVRLVELRGVAESSIQSQGLNRGRLHLRRWSNAHGYVRALVSGLNARRADIVHFHSHLPAFIAQRLYGIPTAYTAHTPLWALGGGHHRGTSKWFARLPALDALIEKSVIRGSRVAVGLGRYVADSVPDANVAAIPNGLDCSTWRPIDRASARRALGLAEDELVVVFAGRIHPDKGIDTLLDAVRLAEPSIPRLTVLAVGPLSGSFDTRDETVTAYAREMMSRAHALPVRFVGFVSNQTVEYRSYLAAADVFVLPSHREPQGVVVLEALAMGTPVIGSASGGIIDMITPDVGRLFPPGDAQALAALLREANGDAETLARMGRNARVRVETLYSWDDAASRYLAEFHKVIDTSATAAVSRAIAREA
jgi:glycosyltransferase involved in cell wall biosynthesis